MDRTQCKMARAALGWRAADLAEAAGVHRVTVARYESGETIDAQSLSAMQKAFEDSGVLFSRRAGRVGVTAVETAAEQDFPRRQLQEAGGAVGKAKPGKSE
jgi:transcriptional regulator with XRE-family HTH domain